jgi:hypothetical protein
VINFKHKLPGAQIITVWYDIQWLCTQTNQLIQCFPIALLIPGKCPVVLIFNCVAGTIRKRYLAGSKMTSDASGRAIKQSSTEYSHYTSI